MSWTRWIEQEQEKKQLEEEQRIREEKERKEQEEYDKLKEAFIVDEEGFDEDPEEDQENKLEKFIQYIKDTKVVVLEDLAAHFQMKTDDTIDRVSTLIKEDKLTGISNKRIFYGAIFRFLWYTQYGIITLKWMFKL